MNKCLPDYCQKQTSGTLSVAMTFQYNDLFQLQFSKILVISNPPLIVVISIYIGTHTHKHTHSYRPWNMTAYKRYYYSFAIFYSVLMILQSHPTRPSSEQKRTLFHLLPQCCTTPLCSYVVTLLCKWRSGSDPYRDLLSMFFSTQ